MSFGAGELINYAVSNRSPGKFDTPVPEDRESVYEVERIPGRTGRHGPFPGRNQVGTPGVEGGTRQERRAQDAKPSVKRGGLAGKQRYW